MRDAPSELELMQLVNAHATRTADVRVSPLAGLFGRGFVAAYDGVHASVRKGTQAADATPNFDVLPDLQLAIGDHVFYYENGNDRIVTGVLNRNAILPENVSLTNLTLTGKLVRSSTLDHYATSNLDDFEPATDAYWWRLDANAPYYIGGVVADPDAEHVWLNVGAFDRTVRHEALTSTDVNRVLCPSNVNFVIPPNGSVRAWYDATSERWRLNSR